MHANDAIAEGQRIFTICNACRYCEGYCAVFPAMERRLDFARGDLDYLANLCHDCGECYDACQYAPPHEFAVNVPKTLAEIRSSTWRRYAWPRSFAALYGHSSLAASLLLVAALLAVILLAVPSGNPAATGTQSIGRGNFYAVVSHSTMVWLFGLGALYVLIALGIGLARFAVDIDEPIGQFLRLSAWREALARVLSLRHLDGGGAGCTLPDRRTAGLRRVFHHLTFYGFLLCFAATVVATLYHYLLGRVAPYEYSSLPVILGTFGGVGLVLGPAGFLGLRRYRQQDTSDAEQLQLNLGFNVLLLATSATGLLLLMSRETAAMRWVLLLHLAIVLALFLTLPYGKFVHGIYRLAALIRYALERRRPAIQIGSE